MHFTRPINSIDTAVKNNTDECNIIFSISWLLVIRFIYDEFTIASLARGTTMSRVDMLEAMV